MRDCSRASAAILRTSSAMVMPLPRNSRNIPCEKDQFVLLTAVRRRIETTARKDLPWGRSLPNNNSQNGEMGNYAVSGQPDRSALPSNRSMWTAWARSRFEGQGIDGSHDVRGRTAAKAARSSCIVVAARIIRPDRHVVRASGQYLELARKAAAGVGGYGLAIGSLNGSLRLQERLHRQFGGVAKALSEAHKTCLLRSSSLILRRCGTEQRFTAFRKRPGGRFCRQ